MTAAGLGFTAGSTVAAAPAAASGWGPAPDPLSVAGPLAVSLTSPVMLLYLVLLAAWIGLKVLVVLWIKRDAERLNADGRAWWIAAILLDLVVLLAWLAARPPPRVRREAWPAGAEPAPARPNGAGPFAAARRTEGPSASPPPPAPRPVPALGAPAASQPSTGARSASVAVGVRSIRCPTCGNVFPVSVDGSAATRVRCPECGTAGSV